MAWDDRLLEEQKKAACHTGGHARLLAGPGTGKTLTLTRRVCYLIQERGVLPEEILIISFSRATAADLRKRLTEALQSESAPVVSTLHAFALKELIRNSAHVRTLPQPIRIADKWEVKNIIMRDLNSMLSQTRSKSAENLLKQLESDWQSLKRDDIEWEKNFPDPEFFGAWGEHRRIYGYTLLAELVYQLKKTIEQSMGMNLAEKIKYLLVDEYQDLNKCDLDVIEKIASNEVEVYIAGDDDQCIYEFRGAHPIGIREFDTDYINVKDYVLEVCMRCGKKIIEIGNFVARQDCRRIGGVLKSSNKAIEGEVRILNFLNENSEAKGVATVCKNLIKNTNTDPGEILILLHSDSQGRYSKPILAELEKNEVPVALSTNALVDDENIRIALSFFNIFFQSKDSLTWRTILKLYCHGIGDKSIEAVYNLAREKDITFYEALMMVNGNPLLISSRYASRLIQRISEVFEKINIFAENNMSSIFVSPAKFIVALETILHSLFDKEDSFETVYSILGSKILEHKLVKLHDLVKVIEEESIDPENVKVDEKVNILSMHQAKGLDSDIVIIIGAEDENIPGGTFGDKLDEMRRLLYVSLTRAKKSLIITYCQKRIGNQSFGGKYPGIPNRTLTQFLKGGAIKPESGENYVLESQNK